MLSTTSGNESVWELTSSGIPPFELFAVMMIVPLAVNARTRARGSADGPIEEVSSPFNPRLVGLVSPSSADSSSAGIATRTRVSETRARARLVVRLSAVFAMTASLPWC